jgi:hypothetical protein
MNRSVLIPPIFAALAITIPESVQLMHRPDSIYIPFITEIPLLIISYALFAIVNIILIAPLSKVVASLTLNRKSGFVLSLSIAVIVSYILFLMDFFNKSTIFHRAYLFGAFLPMFVMAFSSFHYAVIHRKGISNNHDTDA